MAPPDDNAQMPTDPSRIPERTLRALEDLNRNIRALQDTHLAEAAGPQGQVLSGQRMTESRTSPLLVPSNIQNSQQAREQLTRNQQMQGPGQISPFASTAFKEPSEISFKQFREGAKAGWKNRGVEPGDWENVGNDKGRIGGAIYGALNQRRPPRLKENVEANKSTAAFEDQEEAQGMDPDSQDNIGYGKGGSRNRGKRSAIWGMGQEQADELREDRIRIPQFGDWQLDTKLRLARDVLGRHALNNEGTTKGEIAGGVAGVANYGYAHAAEIEQAKRLYQKTMAYGQGGMDAGTALGYSPQNGIGPSNIFGFRNPLAMFTSSAGKQGLGMNLDALTMSRFGTGMSTGQAKEAYESAAGMGFSNQQSGFLGLTTGGDLENVTHGFMAPLMRQGASAQSIAPFLEALKTGTVSLKELRESMKGLTGAAQESRQTVDQMAQGLQQYTTTAVEHGATPQQGINAGMGFTNMTGLSPEVMSNVMQSPLYQAGAMAQTGAMPGNIGQLSGPMGTEVLLHQMDLLKKNINMPGIRDPKTGKVIAGSAKEQNLGFIAQQLGMTTAEAQSLEERKPKIEAQADAQRAIEPGSAWNNVLKGGEGIAKTDILQKKLREREKEAAGQPHLIDKARQEYKAGEGEFKHTGFHPDHLNSYTEYVLKHGGEWRGEQVEGKDQIYNKLWKAGASKKDLKDYYKASIYDSAQTAEGIQQKLGKPVLDQNRSTSVNGVTIGLTPAAEKLFKINEGSESQKNANSGGPSLASQAAHVGIDIAKIFI
jgi:hypothetical protein